MSDLKINTPYTPEEVLSYCRERGLYHLSSKVQDSLDQLDTFVSDGCSLWPDLNYQKCCIDHDIAYWLGGTQREKLRADLRLARCVMKHAGPLMAITMFLGVRGGGPIGQIFKTSWRWGFSQNG